MKKPIRIKLPLVWNENDRTYPTSAVNVFFFKLIPVLSFHSLKTKTVCDAIIGLLKGDLSADVLNIRWFRTSPLGINQH